MLLLARSHHNLAYLSPNKDSLQFGTNLISHSHYAYRSMAAEPIGCAQVFLDRICISSDPELKAQAILSLSGLLKKLLGFTRGFQAFSGTQNSTVCFL